MLLAAWCSVIDACCLLLYACCWLALLLLQLLLVLLMLCHRCCCCCGGSCGYCSCRQEALGELAAEMWGTASKPKWWKWCADSSVHCCTKALHCLLNVSPGGFDHRFVIHVGVADFPKLAQIASCQSAKVLAMKGRLWNSTLVFAGLDRHLWGCGGHRRVALAGVDTAAVVVA